MAYPRLDSLARGDSVLKPHFFPPYGVQRRSFYVHVFSDDSGSISRDGFLCLVGVVARDSLWNEYYDAWDRLLGHHKMPSLHTSDFLSGQGPYERLNLTYPQRLDVLGDFMNVARRSIEAALVVGVDVGAYNLATGASKKRLQPLTFLFLRLLKASHIQMDIWGHRDPVSFYFDDDAAVSPRLYSAWSTIKRFKRLGRNSLAGITFADDVLLPPLQAADLLGCAFTRAYRAGKLPWEDPNSDFHALFHREGEASLPVHAEIWTAEKIAEELPDVIAMARND